MILLIGEVAGGHLLSSASLPADLSFVLGEFLLGPSLWRGKTFTTNRFTGGHSFVSELLSLYQVAKATLASSVLILEQTLMAPMSLCC